MRLITLWLAAHRNVPIAAVSIALWTLANYWYFKTDIDRIRRERKPRGWSVDMASKTSKGGRSDSH